ncbi:MAG TPA: hypothetical protein QGH10_25935 [Armatimonadota bacterium]|nr:hypothetical protein [Armatimonadota bacterium]
MSGSEDTTVNEASDDGLDGDRQGPGDPVADAEPAASTPRPKKKSRIGDVIIVLVLVVVFGGGAFFAAEIKAAIELQVWSNGSARNAIAELQAALEANDATAAGAYFRNETWTITAEDGAITKVKNKAAQQEPPYAIDTILPTGSMDDVPVAFDLEKGKHGAALMVPTADGKIAEYTLRRDADGWYVRMLSPGIPAG